MNKPIRRLSLIVALLFSALLISTTWIQFATAKDLDNGDAEFRKQLSHDRAVAVRAVMVQVLHQLHASAHVVMHARGAANPVGDNASKHGQAKNRRATIVVR